MVSRLILRSAAPSGGEPWELDACPLAYEEAGRQQMHAFPGVRWIRHPSAPNGRGFYRGAAEVVRIVVALLESAGVIRVRNDEELPPGSALSWPIEAEGLRPYQVDGAAWCAAALRNSRGALLADEMGIGKTPQAIRAVDALGSGTVLVVCPKVVERHWKTQIQRWSTRGTDSRAWLVMSYDLFWRRHAKGEIPAVSFAILDEIHYTSSAKSKRSKALAAWRSANRSIPVLGLSGTPMTVRPRDLWHPLELLWPGRFGREYDFQKRYCGGHYEEIPKIEKSVWVADGCSHSDELACRLAAVMLRRTKGQVGLELPPRSRSVIEVELPAKAQRDLQRAAAAIDWKGQPRASIASLLSNVESYKLDAAEELAKEAIANGSRPLIFTTRRDTAEQLAERLGCPFVHGDIAADRRQAILADAFAGVATMQSVTTGIDLVGFDVVIFTGLDWIPSTILQAEARAHRIGQLRHVSVYFLIGLGTLDEVVRSRVIERLDQFAEITGSAGDEKGLASELSGGGTEDELLAEIAAAITSGDRQ